ncbi:MAG: FHA domain-containing protein [Planctomycetes bacterium]|nr:FHA domain-containing protein [Planctomycetota bacterium]
MKAQLLVLTKEGISVSVIDKGKITVGRSSSNTLKVKDRFISRKHFMIEKSGGRYYLTDLGTRNKTILNGQEMTPGETICLDDKSKIKVGDSVIEFSFIPDGQEAKELEPVVAGVSAGNPAGELLTKKSFPKQIFSGFYSKLSYINPATLLPRKTPPYDKAIFTSFLWVLIGIIILSVTAVFIIYPELDQEASATNRILVTNPVNRANNPPRQNDMTKQNQWSLFPLLEEDNYLLGPNYLRPEGEKTPEQPVENNATAVLEPAMSQTDKHDPETPENNVSPEITIYMKDGSEIKAGFLGYQDHRYIIQIEGESGPSLILDEDIKKVSFNK